MLTLDPIWQAEKQQLQFRRLLNAMSYPGRCYELHKDSMHIDSKLAILATLVDSQVSLADPHNLLTKNDWSLLQANKMAADKADYIICDASKKPDFIPKSGTLPCPEKSATLIFMINNLGQGKTRLQLSGPGIAHIKTFAVNGLAHEWLAMRSEWNFSFPLGVDWIFVDHTSIAAIPRSITMELI